MHELVETLSICEERSNPKLNTKPKRQTSMKGKGGRFIIHHAIKHKLRTHTHIKSTIIKASCHKQRGLNDGAFKLLGTLIPFPKTAKNGHHPFAEVKTRRRTTKCQNL